MGRMTRKKAAEVAEQLHVDEDDVLQLPSDDIAAVRAKTKAGTPEPGNRAPLGDLAPNSADSKTHSEDGAPELRKSVRGKKGAARGAAKAKENNLTASSASRPVEEEREVLPDEKDSAPSPASEKAAEDLMKEVPELSISNPLHDTRPKSPQSAAVMLTRSQLKEKKVQLEPEPKSLVDGIGQTPVEQKTMKEETYFNNPAIKTNGSAHANGTETVTQLPLEDPTSPLPTAVPNVISRLRADTPAKRSTSNKENVEPQDMASPQPINYDVLEHAVVSAAPPPGSSRQSSRPEDHIAALDELDDAVENVNRDIPEVQTSPEKPKTKRDKKAAPVVRTTKASQARMSLAQSSKDAAAADSKAPSLGRPRPSTTLGRSSSVRQSSVTKSDLAGRRVTSGTTNKIEKQAVDGEEKKEVVIPHSKPRPVSLSFPTPPPPAKSTKAPTQSTFKLPGEAVAEKLRAAREARLQKVPEEEKKVFKARPVPATLSKAPSVRQTTASKARESVMNGKDLKASTSTSGGVPKRSHSIATTRPSGPRQHVPKESTKPTTTSDKSAPDSLSVKKRPSTALAGTSKSNPLRQPRPSSLAASTGPSTGPRVSSLQAKGTSKGKEVFNRPAAAKAAAEKEKLEKEAAAKKARLEAAERSRQMSREWAEKQKRKLMVAKQAAPKAEVEPSAVEHLPTAETSAAA